MVPQFEKFLFPTLKCFADGEVHNVSEIEEYNIKTLSLSEDDTLELIASGSRTKVKDRTSFAITYLFQAKLIERTKKGSYKISNRGSEELRLGNTDMTKSYLEKYPEFYDFAYLRRKNVVKKNSTAEKPVDSKTEQTPLEQMEDAYNLMTSALVSDLLEEVKSKSPVFFEKLVIRLLVAMGYGGSESDAAKVTRYSHDDGIDGVIKEDKLGLDSIYVQAKRYTSGSVQKPDMQKFIGALSEQGATKGIFITTSTFSSGAIETSKKASHVKIVLIDGEQLASLMIEYNIGVSLRQKYEIKKIDLDFFGEE